uniref:hypothetical protein n=1 Tax=Rhodanobacter glycinis TaxID=582702 RepID=UPI00209BFA07|nr:hypothetical protein [Rhodanobacter glycinis]
MHAHRTFAMLALLLLLTCSVAYAGDDGKADGASYASMLGYLDNSRIGGQAFQGVSGATAINLSAGTLNQQSNLRAFAVGATAQTMIRVRQLQRGDVTAAPLDASARIGDHAFENGLGIVSINQASGNGNAEFNAVSTSLASPGIREATDSSLSASVSASAGGSPPPIQAARRRKDRAASRSNRPPCMDFGVCCNSTRSRDRATPPATACCSRPRPPRVERSR